MSDRPNKSAPAGLPKAGPAADPLAHFDAVVTSITHGAPIEPYNPQHGFTPQYIAHLAVTLQNRAALHALVDIVPAQRTVTILRYGPDLGIPVPPPAEGKADRKKMLATYNPAHYQWEKLWQPVKTLLSQQQENIDAAKAHEQTAASKDKIQSDNPATRRGNQVAAFLAAGAAATSRLAAMDAELAVLSHPHYAASMGFLATMMILEPHERLRKRLEMELKREPARIAKRHQQATARRAKYLEFYKAQKAALESAARIARKMKSDEPITSRRAIRRWNHIIEAGKAQYRMARLLGNAPAMAVAQRRLEVVRFDMRRIDQRPRRGLLRRFTRQRRRDHE